MSGEKIEISPQAEAEITNIHREISRKGVKEGADTDVGFPEKNKHRFQMEYTCLR